MNDLAILVIMTSLYVVTSSLLSINIFSVSLVRKSRTQALDSSSNDFASLTDTEKQVNQFINKHSNTISVLKLKEPTTNETYVLLSVVVNNSRLSSLELVEYSESDQISKLHINGSNKMTILFTGIPTDCHHMKSSIRKWILNYKEDFDGQPSGESIANQICSIIQQSKANSNHRPLVVQSLLICFQYNSCKIYEIDHTGTIYDIEAGIIGSNRVNCIEIMEKEYNYNLTLHHAKILSEKILMDGVVRKLKVFQREVDDDSKLDLSEYKVKHQIYKS